MTQPKGEMLSKQWRDACGSGRPENDPYYAGVYDARMECAEQLEAVAVPQGGEGQGFEEWWKEQPWSYPLVLTAKAAAEEAWTAALASRSSNERSSLGEERPK